jgi:DNA mismatch endonuclease (patch repair protein)
MSRFPCRSTKPEIAVRILVHPLGHRYSTHDRSSPGKPDLVFANKKKVILVHECFWHRHCCPNGTRIPKSRKLFWKSKLDANLKRDRRIGRLRNRDGWRYIAGWECKIKLKASLSTRISEFLESK